jgi:uncharacterized protein (DUF952 family)
VTVDEANDTDILHITTPDEWAAAQQVGAVRPPSLHTEGFVHCSTGSQLDTTLDRHFRGSGRLLVLVLDPDTIAADLRWEESHPGELFPHVYAPIAVDAVMAVDEVTPPRG